MGDEVFSTDNLKVIKESIKFRYTSYDTIYLKYNGKKGNGAILVKNNTLKPLCHVVAFFGTDVYKKEGTYSYVIGDWAGIHTKKCVYPKHYLKDHELLTEDGTPSEELMLLGKYTLHNLIKEYDKNNKKRITFSLENIFSSRPSV